MLLLVSYKSTVPNPPIAMFFINLKSLIDNYECFFFFFDKKQINPFEND